jgi:hypothetical protein
MHAVPAADAPSEPPGRGGVHWKTMPWGQASLFIVAQVAGLIYFVATVREEQGHTRDAMIELSNHVGKLAQAVADSAVQLGRIDEHMRGVDFRLQQADKRLDKLEEGPQWRKNP